MMQIQLEEFKLFEKCFSDGIRGIRDRGSGAIGEDNIYQAKRLFFLPARSVASRLM